MAYFLGVDGGGTGCRAAVCDASGVVLGRAESASANILTDPAGAAANILAAARQAAGAAGLTAALDEMPAVLGLAGANADGAVEALRARLPFRTLRIETDAVIALRGAFGAADGIAATLGTGSVFAAQKAGRIRTLGGWGLILGDQGSGARLGRTLMERALLAHDGLVSGSDLLRAVVAEAGGPEALVTVAAAAAPVDFARHAPRIIHAAAAGDAGAEVLLAEAETYVAAAIERLQDGASAPICFLGGLGPTFAARLSGRFGALTRLPLGSALDGALAMARGEA